MISERTEFLISQYVDGTISAGDRGALEAELAADADARLLAQEYRKLNALLAAQPAPEVDLGALAGRINDAIDEHNARASYRLPFGWPKVGAAVAVAACMLIGLGLWLRPFEGERAGPAVAIDGKPAGVIQIAVLQPEDARLEFGPALQQIRVGPPAGEPYSHVLSEALVIRPNTLFIAKGDRPAQDSTQSLY